MIRSSRFVFFSLIAFSLLFRIGSAQAIPIPTIGAELATQIDQLQKHISELKKVKDQITNGIDQAKAMGDKLSMDALKSFATDKAKSALSGGISGLEIPKAMEEAGFSEDIAADPDEISDWLVDMATEGTGEDYDEAIRKKCWAARESMAKELTKSGLANSIALQSNLASGENMKEAQDASGASDDQMQLLGANTATLKVLYQQAASSTMLEANRVASKSIAGMCD